MKLAPCDVRLESLRILWFTTVGAGYPRTSANRTSIMASTASEIHTGRVGRLPAQLVTWARCVPLIRAVYGASPQLLLLPVPLEHATNAAPVHARARPGTHASGEWARHAYACAHAPDTATSVAAPGHANVTNRPVTPPTWAD